MVYVRYKESTGVFIKTFSNDGKLETWTMSDNGPSFVNDTMLLSPLKRIFNTDFGVVEGSTIMETTSCIIDPLTVKTSLIAKPIK
jgi:hypothetical protein